MVSFNIGAIVDTDDVDTDNIVDTDDESVIQSTMVWLGRRHLAFAVANGVILLDAAATAGSCDG